MEEEKEKKEKKSFSIKKIAKKVVIVSGVAVAAIGGYKYVKEPEFKDKVNSGAKRVKGKVTGWFKKGEPTATEMISANNNTAEVNNYSGNKFGGRRNFDRNNNNNYNN